MATQGSLLLQKQLKDLCKHPVDGFSAGLVDERNIFEWSVTIIGPPETLYDGGYFNAIMSFPSNYPNSPPTVKFISKIWHPNVYTDGLVCISILHPPGEDPNGYELASERWSPVHTVGSIVLSIISMLSSPNDESPANIEAANHLDLHAVLWLESYLVKWPKTFIVVSHAREFLNTVVTDILHLHGQKLIAYKGDYDTFERTREEQLKNLQKAFETNERVRDHMQNMEVLKKMGNYTGITSECAIPIDSSNYVPISKRAPVTAQVVIGTPGTMNKWATTKKLSTNYLKILVFDEANHMLAENSLIPSCFDDELVVHVADCGLAPLISSVSES